MSRAGTISAPSHGACGSRAFTFVWVVSDRLASALSMPGDQAHPMAWAEGPGRARPALRASRPQTLREERLPVCDRTGRNPSPREGAMKTGPNRRATGSIAKTGCRQGSTVAVSAQSPAAPMARAESPGRARPSPREGALAMTCTARITPLLASAALADAHRRAHPGSGASLDFAAAHAITSPTPPEAPWT